MDNYYVFVRRHPYGHGPWDDGSEIPLDKMWDIKWDDEVGGVRTRTPTYFLMGKISWETARHLNIAVSGTHDYSNCKNRFQSPICTLFEHHSAGI